MLRTTLTLGSVLCIAALLPNAARAADPCATPHARSLVLSGGGGKGAFEAGAAYHLIVHRDCDFTEIAGNSVGAINAALLAQAAATSDANASLANLRDAAENLVDQWGATPAATSIRRPRTSSSSAAPWSPCSAGWRARHRSRRRPARFSSPMAACGTPRP